MVGIKMPYWLVKSEPESWSWQDHVKAKVTKWDGVRNYQARNNMKAMAVGDYVLFYQSVKNPQIVGIVQVVKDHYPDPDDTRFVLVDLAYVATLPTPVPLKTIKDDPRFQDLPLVRQSRLSVMPLPQRDWDALVRLGGLDPHDI